VSWRVRVAKDAKPDVYKIRARTDGAAATLAVPVRRSPTGILFSGLTN
jgi:hypothetical protein